jgi:hypothetical protein
MADWNKIKTEYITTDTSYRKLAQKYGVNATTIAKKAGKEDWVAQRNQQASKTLSKTLNAISKAQANRASRLQTVADKLLDKIENAVDGFDMAELLVDKQALKQLTGALKDIKDIQMIKSEADLREQEARIAKLQKEAEKEEKDNEIEIVIGDGTEEYSI